MNVKTDLINKKMKHVKAKKTDIKENDVLKKHLEDLQHLARYNKSLVEHNEKLLDFKNATIQLIQKFEIGESYYEIKKSINTLKAMEEKL